MNYIDPIIRYGAVLTLLIAAAVQDLHERRIRNYLCVIGVLVGLILALPRRMPAVKAWGLGLAVAFGVSFLLWRLGMFCAGDAKLFCVIGACWGVDAFLNCFILTVLVGGVFSVVYMLIMKEFRTRMKKVLDYFKALTSTLVFRRYAPPDELDSQLPFSLFILAGAILSVVTGNDLFFGS